jgi:hypothetical protein
MKKTAIMALGLMSLLALSSCEDKFSYIGENQFLPIGYQMKSPEKYDEESSTVQVMGIKKLIFDEFEKSDWKIVTQPNVIIRGDHPLEFSKKIYKIEDINDILDLDTNFEEKIPLAFTNTLVTYQYLGEETILEPLDEEGFLLQVSVEEEKRVDDGQIFTQVGYIVYRLMVGYVPVKIHKQPFVVASKIEEK